jgi:hypothetical protein
MIVSWQEGKRRVGCEPIDQPARLATSREQVRAIDEWRRKEPDLPSRNKAILRLIALALQGAAGGQL